MKTNGDLQSHADVFRMSTDSCCFPSSPSSRAVARRTLPSAVLVEESEGVKVEWRAIGLESLLSPSRRSWSWKEPELSRLHGVINNNHSAGPAKRPCSLRVCVCVLRACLRVCVRHAHLRLLHAQSSTHFSCDGRAEGCHGWRTLNAGTPTRTLIQQQYNIDGFQQIRLLSFLSYLYPAAL